MSPIAVIGVGNMGWPMAANLVVAGFDVTVLDVAPGRARRFADEVGGRAAVGAVDAVRGAEVVVTMLPTSGDVAAVLDDAAGALAPGTVVVDMSSGAPAATRRLAAGLAHGGVALVDCPVSGGVARAATGELTIMAGGEAALIEQVMPVLRAVGTIVHRCGPVGAGHAMKALNNLVSAGGFLIGIEALLIGERFGLDPARMVEVLNASTGRNNSTEHKFAQHVLTRAYASGFGLDLMAKDVGIAAELARQLGVASPFTEQCSAVWAGAVEVLGRGRDHTELARLYEAADGLVP